jgi:hypothetical protein
MTVSTRCWMLIPLIITVFALGAASALAQVPEVAGAEPPGEPEVEAPQEGDGKDGEKDQVLQARLKLRLRGLTGGRLEAGDRFTVSGTLAPYVKGEKVILIVRRGTKTIKRKVVKPKRKKGSNFSRFAISQRQIAPGRYSVQAIHKRSSELSFSEDRTKSFKLHYPDLREGQRSSTVGLFNRLLAKLGYVNHERKSFDAATGRAVLAFRKVNQLSWTQNATGAIFKKLAKGKGGYKLRHPGSGKHVEVDLSRQVMVLAKGDRVKEIYHVSSGAAATPTLTGSWRFYRKEPGYNQKEMYYSVYWNRGYATHGYKSVPTHPASHGCVRNPPEYAKHIYDWIDLGDLIHIYR